MIDPTTQLAAMIRAQFAAQFKAQTKERPQAATQVQRRDNPTAANHAPPPSPSGEDDARIQQMVALRVRALAADDPQRQRKAFRLFLESVLVQTLGRERLDDRGFDQMVDAVMQRMESDPQLNSALHEAGDLLLADTKPNTFP